MEQWMINTLAFIGAASIAVSLGLAVMLFFAERNIEYDHVIQAPPLPLPPVPIYINPGQSFTVGGVQVIATRQELSTAYDPPESDTDTMTRYFAAREELEREKASEQHHHG